MYDGDRLIAELDDQGAVIATLSWGAAGLFAYGSTQYQFDLQGSVVARTSSIGSVLSTHWYDAHGTEQTTPSTDSFGYKGQWGYYTDRETGLILCTHRYLDPAAGRWLTRDPISYTGGVNLYSYCGNGVLLHADAAGLDHQRKRRRLKNVPFENQKFSHHYWVMDDGTEIGFGPDGIVTGPGSNNRDGYPVADVKGRRSEVDAVREPDLHEAMEEVAEEVLDDWNAQRPITINGRDFVRINPDGSREVPYNLATNNCQHFCDAIYDEARRRAAPPPSDGGSGGHHGPPGGPAPGRPAE